MTKQSFTPGPWHVTEDSCHGEMHDYIDAENDVWIAKVNNFKNSHENGRLIASSPELLEMLDFLIFAHDAQHLSSADWQAARELVKKARGEK